MTASEVSAAVNVRQHPSVSARRWSLWQAATELLLRYRGPLRPRRG